MRKMSIPKKVLVEAYTRLKTKKAVCKELGVSKKVIDRLFKGYEIAKELGLSIATVRERFKKYDIRIDKSAGKNKKLNKMAKEVAIGSLLGDGYIANRSLEITHSVKQLDYLKYKLNLIAYICKGDIYPRKDRGKLIAYRFRTEYLDDIGKLKEKWYANGKKIIPVLVRLSLTPLAIAIWYMDDGGRRGKNAGRIATCRYTKSEVERLSNALNRRYNLTTCVRQEGKYHTIYIPYKNDCFKKFCSIIRMFVPECMQYKLFQV